MKRPLLTCALILALFSARAPGAGAPDTVIVDSETEGVIHGALQYLAAHQRFDGSWTQAPNSGAYPVAMTGYALLAFLSAGNLPDDGEYGRNVSQGMQYLIDQIEPNGIFRDAEQQRYMYSHGIATVALSELYGETRSPLLRQKLSQIVNVIVAAQSPPGGWRYLPASRDADISVTVCQVAALRAAKNAGLDVPQAALDRAVDFIDKCYNDQTGAFAYQPRTPPGFARTAAAIYSLQLCGKYDDPRVAKGSDYLFANDSESVEWWPYGCYYARPAEYMIGGEAWKRWYGEMRTHLLADVIRDGDACHWDQRRSEMLGPIYETSVFVTILATPYHYLPLYQR